MLTTTLETLFFLGALCACAHGHAAHLDGELGDLAEKLLTVLRPLARA